MKKGKPLDNDKQRMVIVLVSVARASLKHENFDHLIDEAFKIMEDYKHNK